MMLSEPTPVRVPVTLVVVTGTEVELGAPLVDADGPGAVDVGVPGGVVATELLEVDPPALELGGAEDESGETDDEDGPTMGHRFKIWDSGSSAIRVHGSRVSWPRIYRPTERWWLAAAWMTAGPPVGRATTVDPEPRARPVTALSASRISRWTNGRSARVAGAPANTM